MTKLKICGLTRAEDVKAVNAARPAYVGFVFAKSLRQVSKEQALSFRKELDAGIAVVGVFNQTVPNGVLWEILQSGAADMAQLHGKYDEDFILRLREKGFPVIRAVSVSQKEDIERQSESAADFLLLDNGPGGTGRAFDWNLCRYAKRPYFLAGGINEENLAATLRLTPFAVDISSGAETNGQKDAAKICRLAELVRKESV